MPSLNAFIDSLTKEHDKHVQMGSMTYSKDQYLFDGGTEAKNDKGNPKQKEKTKFYHPKQKKKTKQTNEPSGSKKDKQRDNEKTKCSYCGMEYHPESSCMNKSIDKMALLLEKNNITLLHGARKKDNGDQNDHPKRGHTLMASVLNSKSLLIDLRAQIHMVARK